MWLIIIICRWFHCRRYNLVVDVLVVEPPVSSPVPLPLPSVVYHPNHGKHGPVSSGSELVQSKLVLLNLILHPQQVASLVQWTPCGWSGGGSSNPAPSSCSPESSASWPGVFLSSCHWNIIFPHVQISQLQGMFTKPLMLHGRSAKQSIVQVFKYIFQEKVLSLVSHKSPWQFWGASHQCHNEAWDLKDPEHAILAAETVSNKRLWNPCKHGGEARLDVNHLQPICRNVSFKRWRSGSMQRPQKWLSTMDRNTSSDSVEQPLSKHIKKWWRGCSHSPQCVI